jgi:hypothetical protein
MQSATGKPLRFHAIRPVKTNAHRHAFDVAIPSAYCENVSVKGKPDRKAGTQNHRPKGSVLWPRDRRMRRSSPGSLSQCRQRLRVVVCPFFFYWSKPMTVPREFSKLLTGVLMFGAFTLAIVITAYQILSPQDSIFLWIQDVWETSPFLIFAMGFLMFPGKRWIDGYSQD